MIAAGQPIDRPAIARDVRILGGAPIVAGARVPVRAIVLTYHLYEDLDDVQRAFPMLDRAAIETARAFYDHNREEIDRYIAENEEPEEV